MVEYSDLFDGEIEEFTKKAKVSFTRPTLDRSQDRTDSQQLNIEEDHRLIRLSLKAFF